MAASAIVALLFCGCSGPAGNGPSHEGPEPARAPVEVVADWNDIDASVLAAVSQSEAAVLSITEESGAKVFKLLYISNEPGTLRVWAADPSKIPTDKLERAAPSIELRLSATVGYWGHPERERKLERDVEKRLKQLAGVEFAPLPSGWSLE